MATIRKLNMVPKFPSSTAARAFSGAGGRMLGQKMAIQQAGQMVRSGLASSKAAADRGLKERRLDFQIASAEDRNRMAADKTKAYIGKINRSGLSMSMKELLPEYRQYLTRLDKRNDARMKMLKPSERGYFQEEKPMSLPEWRKSLGIVVPELDYTEQGQGAPEDMAQMQDKIMNQEVPSSASSLDRTGGASGLMPLIMALSKIPQENRGRAISGIPGADNVPGPKGQSWLDKLLMSIPQFAEGGIVDSPQMAMVGEQGREFIVPEDKIDPQMAQRLKQIVGGQQGQAPTKEGLAQLMSQIPKPEKVISDRLPKIEQLLQELEGYDSAEEMLKDLIELDESLMEAGLDLADVKGIQLLIDQVQEKFGPETAQKLMDEAVSRRQ